MINPISSNATPGTTPTAAADSLKVKTAIKTEHAQLRPTEAPVKLETPIKDSVQLSHSAQARALRRAGESIPQIAIKLGLAIPTVAAFFED
ncbi:MAG: hypothetical protein ABSG21_11125 [Spirochaetia bacterium]|jgi:hypothetical protein